MARPASLKAQGVGAPTRPASATQAAQEPQGILLPASDRPQGEGVLPSNWQADEAIDPAWLAAYAAASDPANQPSSPLPPGVPPSLTPHAAATARADHSFVPLPPPPEPPPPPSQPPGSPPPSPLPPLPHATDLCYNCTLVCVAPYAELGSLSTTLPASLRLEFGYGEEAVAAEVSPEGEGGASEGGSPPRYLSPLSQHERELLAPLDAPTDEFGGSFALIRVTAVSASTEEPSGGRSAAHIADGSGLRHYVEGAAYDGTPPAIYHPMPPPARRQTPAAQISSPLPTRARFHAPTCTPPRSRLHAPIPHASLPLYPPAPRPSSLLSSTHRSTSHAHAHARLSAGRFVGGRYTPLPGGPGGAGDDAPSRPGTTVNSFCDAPHGLECGGLCWGSDVRVRSALHGGIAL